MIQRTASCAEAKSMEDRRGYHGYDVLHLFCKDLLAAGVDRLASSSEQFVLGKTGGWRSLLQHVGPERRESSDRASFELRKRAPTCRRAAPIVYLQQKCRMSFSTLRRLCDSGGLPLSSPTAQAIPLPPPLHA